MLKRWTLNFPQWGSYNFLQFSSNMWHYRGKNDINKPISKQKLIISNLTSSKYFTLFLKIITKKDCICHLNTLTTLRKLKKTKTKTNYKSKQTPLMPFLRAFYSLRDTFDCTELKSKLSPRLQPLPRDLQSLSCKKRQSDWPCATPGPSPGR